MTLGKMTPTERLLHVGARRHMPGTEHYLVIIYRATRPREALRMAATISCFLQEASKVGTLADLRRQVEAAKPTRKGAAMDRYVAAIAALDALDVMIGGDT